MNSQQVAQFYKEHRAKKFGGIMITTLNGHKIAQWHHPNPTIRKIYGENQIKQFTSIQVVGTPGTGKSTLVTYIAHRIHTIDPSYLIFQFGKKELLNFEETMDSLPNRNLILIFDDVSAVFKLIKDQEKKARILQTLTEARHPKLEKTDRKVIFIVNTHYENSMEKMWRSQANWKLYTDLSGEEKENLNARTKGRYKQRLESFANIVDEELSNINDKTKQAEYHIKISDNKTFTYSPWDLRFVLVYNGSKLRTMLIPNESCALCAIDKNKIEKKTGATPDEIIELAQKYYNKHGIAGLKLALLVAGQTKQYQNQLIYAYNTCKDLLATFDIDHAKLAQRMRERAEIKGTGLYTIKRKKTNFFADLEKIRHGEAEKISKEIEPEEDNNKSELDIDSMDAEQSQTETIIDES